MEMLNVLLEKYEKKVSSYLSLIDFNRLSDLINIIWMSHNKHKIFFIGNGGSISTAAHFANDLKSLSPGFMTYCLNDANTMTCIGNDRGFDLIFYEPIISLAQPGDVVIMFSASGNSPNLLKAVEACKYKSAISAAIVGFDGGQLKTLADLCVHVESPLSLYREVEDCHSILGHFMVDYIDGKMTSEYMVKAGFNRGETNIFEV
jgi:D-sedoheptulose 7-phosphate isomerase